MCPFTQVCGSALKEYYSIRKAIFEKIGLLVCALFILTHSFNYISVAPPQILILSG
jgi:hypothetical protein